MGSPPPLRARAAAVPAYEPADRWATGGVAALIAAVVVAVAGCGGGDDAAGARTRPATPPAGATATAAPSGNAAGRGPVPPALGHVESAAEDTIDYALAGRRGRVVATARSLKAAADGPAGAELRAAGVPAAEIAEFRDRATRVAELAPTAPLLSVALASNRAFAMVPGFFALYETPVPAAVMGLDHLDFEAKLRATARDGAGLRAASAGLGRTWADLRPGVVSAGGAGVARVFDAHVVRLRRLAGGGDATAAVREAQHGLDLVDEIEGVYR